MNITDLGGHSGCKIILCEEGDRIFVRKISNAIDYNSRLKMQAEKQDAFQSPTVKTPKIYSMGYTEDGLFYFDMEYIQGITLAEQIGRIEIGKIRGFVESLISSIITYDKQDKVDTKPFTRKIASLKEELEKHKNANIDKALELLNIHDWSFFGQSFCHGDLTLENIIIKGDRIYLIDFLDSFYDNWLLDVGTLLQDVLTMWSYRYQETVSINTVLRLMMFQDILVDSVREKIGKKYIEIYYALLLKLVRIFPYCKDATTYQFLTDKIGEIISTIKKEEAEL